jgi:hypothetical protein
MPATWNGISARTGVPARLCGLLAPGLGHATLQAWRTGQGPLAQRLLTAGRRRQLRTVRESETEHGHRTVTAAVQEYADGQVRQSTQQL